MRLVQRVLLMLLAMASARADYQYFYPCDSTPVCATFSPSAFYGDFGMNGHPNVSPFDPASNYSVEVFASNAAGEVLAYVDTAGFGSSGPATGSGGNLQMIPQLIDPLVGGGGYISADGTWVINDLCDCGNGNWLAWVNGGVLNNQVDSTAIAQELGVENFGGSGASGFPFASSVAEGINDLDQILVQMPIEQNGQWQQVRGVLSPFAVPEPSTLLLLATAAASLVSRSRR